MRIRREDLRRCAAIAIRSPSPSASVQKAVPGIRGVPAPSTARSDTSRDGSREGRQNGRSWASQPSAARSNTPSIFRAALVCARYPRRRARAGIVAEPASAARPIHRTRPVILRADQGAHEIGRFGDSASDQRVPEGRRRAAAGHSDYAAAYSNSRRGEQKRRSLALGQVRQQRRIGRDPFAVPGSMARSAQHTSDATGDRRDRAEAFQGWTRRRAQWRSRTPESVAAGQRRSEPGRSDFSTRSR